MTLQLIDWKARPVRERDKGSELLIDLVKGVPGSKAFVPGKFQELKNVKKERKATTHFSLSPLRVISTTFQVAGESRFSSSSSDDGCAQRGRGPIGNQTTSYQMMLVDIS